MLDRDKLEPVFGAIGEVVIARGDFVRDVEVRLDEVVNRKILLD